MTEATMGFLTNVLHAKPCAHALVALFGIAEAVWLYLNQQAIFTAWLSHHPWIPVAHGALQAGCVAAAMYFQSLNRAA